MTTLEYLIRHYGYLGVLVGTFLEGETVLVLAGLAAHLGYLQLPFVILTAFTGALGGDLLYFFLGHRHGQSILARHAHWQGRVEKLQKMLARYHSPVILLSRFLYGLRMVAPFAMGMSRVPPGRYILLDSVSVLLWALAVGVGGYLFGNVLAIILGDIKHYEAQVLGVIAGAGLLIWLLLYLRQRKSQDGQIPSEKMGEI
jgi:membrane protein DedA with SNARE-associated domain